MASSGTRPAIWPNWLAVQAGKSPQKRGPIAFQALARFALMPAMKRNYKKGSDGPWKTEINPV